MRTADACIALLGASSIAFHEKFETLGWWNANRDRRHRHHAAIEAARCRAKIA
jgi:hypothetical protein